MTDKTLKPCPFCGCTEVAMKVRKTAIAECTSCGALVIKLTEAEAIAAWNKRAEATND